MHLTFKATLLTALLAALLLSGCGRQEPLPTQAETRISETSAETTALTIAPRETTQAPFTEPSAAPTTEPPLQETMEESYRDLLSTPNDFREFALIDLDGDGEEACIFWDSRQRISLYTQRNGVFTQATTMDGGSLHGQLALCDGGILKTWEEPEPDHKVYSFYRVIDGRLVLQNQVDWDEGRDTWTQMLGGIPMGTMSREDAEVMLNTYTEIALCRQPIENLP